MAQRRRKHPLASAGLAGAKRRARRTAAFTLVEVLLALTITAILVGTIYDLFSLGLDAWRQNTNESRLSFEGSYLCDALARDLRGALDLETKDAAAFAGSERSMEFFTGAIRPGERQWPVCRVRYTCEKPAAGSWSALGVEVTPFAGTVALVKDPSAQVLLDRVYSFALRYYSNRRWEDKWQDKGLPSAVEISLEIGTDDARAKRQFKTVVDLPCVKKGS
jgi:prepilin-type N-terminal cleavage/methylation domain-containing protein